MTAPTAGTAAIHQRRFQANGEQMGALALRLLVQTKLNWEESAFFVLKVLMSWSDTSVVLMSQHTRRVAPHLKESGNLWESLSLGLFVFSSNLAPALIVVQIKVNKPSPEMLRSSEEE